MKDIRKTIIVIAILVFLVISVGLWLAISKDIPVFFVWSAISSGIITLFGFLWIGYDPEKKPAIDTSTMRTALTSSIVMVYLYIVCLTTFFRGWSDKLDPLPQAMVSNFTIIVGVVIAFYFTSSAYVQTRNKPPATTTDKKISSDGLATQ
jgi:multisubunit Na+/H+ antiporter MnhC subunit